MACEEVRHNQALEVLPYAWSLWKVNEKAMAFGTVKIKVAVFLSFLIICWIRKLRKRKIVKPSKL